MRRWFFAFIALAFALTATPASAGLQIYVNKAAQRMTVKENGRVKYTWAVSTGTGGYPTPSGTFRPVKLVRDYYSARWKAKMPWSVFIVGDTIAIHGTAATGRLGSPASHGCIRLSNGNAASLFALVKKYGRSTTVTVR